MGPGRGLARPVLACHPPAGHVLRAPGRSGQAALADRTRLPGAETGTGPRALRGTRLARLPSSRHLCIAAYAFLIAERASFPPSAAGDPADQCATLGVPQNPPARGAAGPPRTT